MNATDTALIVGGSSSGAEELAKARRSRVVAAFGTIPGEVLLAYQTSAWIPNWRIVSNASGVKRLRTMRAPGPPAAR